MSDSSGVFAIICAYELRFGLFRSGAVTVDLELSWFAESSHTATRRALRAALRLLAQRRGVRRVDVTVYGDPRRIESICALASDAQFDVSIAKVEVGALLRIADIGRNAITERSSLQQMWYVPQVPHGAFRRAVWTLLEQGAACDEAVARSLALIEHAERPFLAGVRFTNGAWLSVAGGWFENGRLVIAFELTQPPCMAQPSACHALRTFILQDLLAAREVEEILFRRGLEGILQPLTAVQSGLKATVSKRSLWSRLFNRLAGSTYLSLARAK